MMPRQAFRTGLEGLLEHHRDWLTGHRIGLVSHHAAVDCRGTDSATSLHREVGGALTALFGPEHGFAGQAAAGEATHDGLHPEWKIPVYSLYGEHRKPTPAMLEQVDLLVIEFQDIGARPYTYGSTLRLVLEAAAEARLPVIVADRPVPLPSQVDGPMLEPSLTSFVGMLPSPMQYGMTCGETALWLKHRLGLEVELRVAAMQGYNGDAAYADFWPPWIPPSPRMHTWETACLFTGLVMGEALPALDYGSGTLLAFRVVGAPWIESDRLLERLDPADLPGLRLSRHRYVAQSGLYCGVPIDGVRIAVERPELVQPVASAMVLLSALQDLYGTEPLWTAPETREAWFDQLFGSRMPRTLLQAGRGAREIIDTWKPELARFRDERKPHLLYERAM